jgi:chromosome segregation ATPase
VRGKTGEFKHPYGFSSGGEGGFAEEHGRRTSEHRKVRRVINSGRDGEQPRDDKEKSRHRVQAEKTHLEERVSREQEEAQAKLVGSQKRAAEEKRAMENSLTALRGELENARAENSVSEGRISMERKEGEAKLEALKVELERERERAVKALRGLEGKEVELEGAEDLLWKEKEERVGSRLEVTRLTGEVARVSAEKAGAEARAKNAAERLGEERACADTAQKQLAIERARADNVKKRHAEAREHAKRQLTEERARADRANKLVAEQREQMGVLKAIMDQFAVKLKAVANQREILGSCFEDLLDAKALDREALLGEPREGQALTPQLNQPELLARNVISNVLVKRKLKRKGTAERGEDERTLGVDVVSDEQNQAVGSQEKNGVDEAETGGASDASGDVATGVIGDGGKPGSKAWAPKLLTSAPQPLPWSVKAANRVRPRR